MSFFNFGRSDVTSSWSSRATDNWSSWSSHLNNRGQQLRSNLFGVFDRFRDDGDSKSLFRGVVGVVQDTLNSWKDDDDSDSNGRVKDRKSDDDCNNDTEIRDCESDRDHVDNDDDCGYLPEGYRSIDGSGYNPDNPEFGQAGAELTRVIGSDTTREPGGSTEVNLPSARMVSNAVVAQTESTSNSKGLSDLFWLWGQFLDHDLTHSDTSADDSANISVPMGDSYFDPYSAGDQWIGLSRSTYVLDDSGNRMQSNEITAWLDGSNVYGSDDDTASSLRSFEGGHMLTSDGDLLPTNATSGMYMAGDSRANENIGLTSMHTLWVREHNRIADDLAAEHPDWDDETLYQEARATVIAEMQVITYNEFLPLLLGEDALDTYQGYQSDVSPDISAAFSTAAYRLGHTMLSPQLLRLDEKGEEIAEGNVALRDAFFNPSALAEAGIDPLLRGAATQTAQAVDPMIIDDVRNFLFGEPGQGGFDLASLNIQRGRDHALPGLNDAREALGLSRIESFDDPIFREGFGAKLAEVYDSVDDVDLWVGGLAEVPTGDSLVGETFQGILVDQFTRIRDADPYWYSRMYDGEEQRELEQTTLADIIRRNSGVTDIQDHAFIATGPAAVIESATTVEEPAVMSMAMPMMTSMSVDSGDTVAMMSVAPMMMSVDAVSVDMSTTDETEAQSSQQQLLREAIANGWLG